MKTNLFPFLHEPVSRLGCDAFHLGGMYGACDQRYAIDVLHRCWAHGVNFLDTTRLDGRTEAVIGAALKMWNGKRPIIATKAQAIGPDDQWVIPQPVEVCYPRGHITRELEESLRTLGVDSIDLFQLHLYWPNWGVDGYWLDELEVLQAAGKIRSFGVALPDHRSDLGLPLVLSGRIHSVQTVFNVMDPTPLDCLVPICARWHVAVIARGVWPKGELGSSLQPEQGFPAEYNPEKCSDDGSHAAHIDRAEALRQLVPTHASSLRALALKFVLKTPGVTTALISLQGTTMTEECIRILSEPPLADDVFDRLRRLRWWNVNLCGKNAL